MSVPLYKRSVSKKEYYYNFKKIQKEIISLLLRDFGIKEQKDEIIECPMWRGSRSIESLKRATAYKL